MQQIHRLTYESWKTPTKVGGGAVRGLSPFLFGKTWWLPRSTRFGTDYVGCSPRLGLHGNGRSCGGSRVHGTSHCCFGAGGSGWKLGDSLFSHVDRRAPVIPIPRETGECDPSWKAFRSIGSTCLGCDMPIIHKGDGDVIHPQEGNHSQGQSRQVREGRDRLPLPEEETSISQEAERVRRWPELASGLCHSHSEQSAQPCKITPSHTPASGDVPVFGGDEFVSATKTLNANAKFKRDSSRTVSFNVWCSELMVSVLRSRTFFSAYVVKAIRTPRSEVKSTSAIYPMPVPFPLAFRRMPPGCSSVKRHKIYFLRAINVVVLALNFWWRDGKNTDSHLLGRALNRRLLAVVSRIRSVMLADDPGTEIPSVSCGRKFRPSVEAPELQPYHSLDSSRLKLTGTGEWDATEFLSDELAVAYRYPDILLLDRCPAKDEYPQFHDDSKEVGKLARLWDSRGLLFIHKVDLGKHAAHGAVRVFNNYKNSECDRQIGDRRGRNAVEARVSGPSAHLPAGTDLMDLWIPVRSHRFSINITDRSDFYHQFFVSENRALANTVLPSLGEDELKSTNALAAYSLAFAQKNCGRLKQGDRLSISSRQRLGGVEVATDAHIGLLQRAGLLRDECRLESDRPFGGKGSLEGLVIDDYFSIGVVPRGETSQGHACDSGFSFGLSAVEKLEKAREVYKKHGLIGSPHKDIIDADSGKVIGAWLNSSDQASKLGVATLGSPIEKRLGLSLITLAMCQQRYTTDALTSVLGFRRQLLSILNSAYGLVDASKLDSSQPRLVALPRSICQELVLVSVLSVMAVMDLSLDVHEHVFGTDASNSHGAIVSTTLPRRLSWMITRMCKCKGAYTRILSPFESVLSY